MSLLPLSENLPRSLNLRHQQQAQSTNSESLKIRRTWEFRELRIFKIILNQIWLHGKWSQKQLDCARAQRARPTSESEQGQGRVATFWSEGTRTPLLLLSPGQESPSMATLLFVW